ncbi:tetra-peptide repeat homeobox protein 1-like [Macrobrachium nipponense]|uniref:tetra-peptide repeat homeobox protein 1-like n=1 Tax=Macrobrachium nipponense TaxID=159736 RepID=UPI0030C833AB
MEIRLRSPRQFYLLLLLAICAAAAADRNGRPGNKRNDGPIRFGSPFPVGGGPFPGPISGAIPGPIPGAIPGPIPGAIPGPIPGAIQGPIPIGGGGQRYSPFGTPLVRGVGALPPHGLPIPGLQPQLPPPYSLVPPPMGRTLGGPGLNPIHPPLGGGAFAAPPIHLHYPMNHGASPFLSLPGHHQGPVVPFSTPLQQHLSKPIQPSQPLVNSLSHSAAPDLKEGKVCHDCDVGKHSTHFKVHDGGPVRQVVTSSHSLHASSQIPGSFPDLGIGNFAGGAHDGVGTAAVSSTHGGFIHGGSSDLLGFGARIPGASPGVSSAASPFGENAFGSGFGGGGPHSGGHGGGFGGSLHPGGGFGGSPHPGGGLGTAGGGGGGTPLVVDDGRSSYSFI